MRRSRTGRDIKRTGDIRQDLTEAQLAGIGAVALAYNEAEVVIDALMTVSLNLLTRVAREVTGRIHGIDGKIAIAKSAMLEKGASDEIMGLVGETLGDSGFAEYKRYRDAIVHALILDAPSGIAISPKGRGAVQEVLLTVEALNGLYERLRFVRLELIEAVGIAMGLITEQRFGLIRLANRGEFPGTTNATDLIEKIGPPTQSVVQEIQDATARYREHQKNRKCLPPLPKFPEEPPSGPETAG